MYAFQIKSFKKCVSTLFCVRRSLRVAHACGQNETNTDAPGADSAADGTTAATTAATTGAATDAPAADDGANGADATAAVEDNETTATAPAESYETAVEGIAATADTDEPWYAPNLVTSLKEQVCKLIKASDNSNITAITST